MSKKVLIFVLLGVGCMCSLICVGIAALVSLSPNGFGTATISTVPQPTTDYEPNDLVGYTPIVLDNSGTPVNLKVEDIYNTNLVFKQDTSAVIPELDWMNYIVKTAKNNGWDGSEKSKLPIDPNSISQSYVDELEAGRKTYEERFLMPSNIRKFYIGQTAENEITKLMSTIRNEYVDYLKAKGINNKYIVEINTNAFPAGTSNMFYHGVTDVATDPTQVQTLIGADGSKSDYSKLQMDIYADDIFNHTRKLFNSGILGTQPAEGSAEFDAYYTKARSVGLRYLMYHEMSHVLERVVDNTNVPIEDKTSKGNWGRTPKSMFNLDKKYYINWSTMETTTDVYNHELSQESQAEGISFEVLTSVYNMSDVQKRLTWEFLFARVNGFRDKFDEVISIFASKYPNFEVTDIQQKTYDDVIAKLDPMSDRAQTLYQTNKKLGNLPAYAGYLHPREPQDMPVLWEFLK